jgi:hypothetical protein
LKLSFYGNVGTTTYPDFAIFSNSFKAQIKEPCGSSVIRLIDKKPAYDESKAIDYLVVSGYPRLIYIGYLNAETRY